VQKAIEVFTQKERFACRSIGPKQAAFRKIMQGRQADSQVVGGLFARENFLSCSSNGDGDALVDEAYKFGLLDDRIRAADQTVGNSKNLILVTVRNRFDQLLHDCISTV